VVREVVGKIEICRFWGGRLAARVSSFVDLKANEDLTRHSIEFSVKIFQLSDMGIEGGCRSPLQNCEGCSIPVSM